MYLKSIEIQGFKSFANKILLQFHNGITGIVGPNGSGKSNVADAVRWVLGEQSAKQLRGGNMQDVIFAGTENRKPLSYASVAITLDNSDQKLPISYQEVTVTRRLYRSGESEYLLNGTACRLKDINELFYDTGIGKEGYSIIGQGQIDKILSGRPEERRELFDEAAGIVKFKRRKVTAQKKLEEEEKNLTRVSDILNELTKQLGPLEKQAQKAKIYLDRREKLKVFDVNLFLMEMTRVRALLKEIEEKQEITDAQIQSVKEEQEGTKADYEKIERILENLGTQIEDLREKANKAALLRQELENQIRLFEEQIHSIAQNESHYRERVETIEEEKKSREAQKVQYGQELEAIEQEMKGFAAQEQENEGQRQSLAKMVEEAEAQIQAGKDQMITLLNKRSSTKVRMQRYDTMLEQIAIRKAELSQKILRLRSEESEQETVISELSKEAKDADEHIAQMEKREQELEGEAQTLQKELTVHNQAMESTQTLYHREASRLESLVNITEQYEGYGNSIRRVMEKKNQENGILGVVADLIQVEKSYETAIETALGGSVQNIVTEEEQTAKRMIEYLKKNRYGRATFLPLTAIRERGAFTAAKALEEPGVIGLASTLVRADEKYHNLVQYLLGKTVVVDEIDHALALAKKYSYSLRIVTLEGESLNPGGSMTGGAFKNAGNLLGRRREIDELTKHTNSLKEKLAQAQKQVEETRQKRAEIREEIVKVKELLQKEYLDQNTVQMKLAQMKNKQSETRAGYVSLKMESSEIEGQILEITEGKKQIDQEILRSIEEEKDIEQTIERKQAELLQKRSEQEKYMVESAQIGIRKVEISQKKSYLKQDFGRICQELENLQAEQVSLSEKQSQEREEKRRKEAEIGQTKERISSLETETEEGLSQIEQLQRQKEEKNTIYKSFFQKREEISEKIRALDKESFRLNAQKEKAQEWKERQINYLWEEYEMTPSQANDYRKDEMTDSTQLKKDISQLKNEIRLLGSVNVNAVEEYKELSERHTFLSTQHDDLIRAKESLEKIIEELDEGMRAQFKEKFAQIQVEFDKAFKQLFGGGKGTLELMEGEDLLEAGIRIIAQPPGKKLQNMMQLSGGEKALTAIALLFAIQNLKPSPFCLLDEIEAALDDSNVGRYARYLHKLTKNTQFIIITHRRGTMEAADRLYGITMQEKGVSTLVSVNLIEGELDN
ncbi:MAG: chromosome segregation protein SMC [Lachnospiraceae bacterium]|nr:chromosome segregation protein SMC [Robinsoniella sp.]MDY3765155.1 chromosome segregation protein SMC [Lachnospiraceae bacterium]